jgi:hypothetical protein
MIARMAAEIGLTSPSRAVPSRTDDQNANERRWNDLRTRAFLILNEYR